jgi:hypothetical protein
MSSVIGVPSRKVGFDNQTLPESADDHRATQLHHVSGRHRVAIEVVRKLDPERSLINQLELP